MKYPLQAEALVGSSSVKMTANDPELSILSANSCFVTISYREAFNLSLNRIFLLAYEDRIASNVGHWENPLKLNRTVLQ